MKIELNNGEVLTAYGRNVEQVLAKLLANVIDKTGRVPSYSEIKEISTLPKNTNIYMLYFGTYNQACKVACKIAKKYNPPTGKKRKYNGKWTKERVISALKQYYEEHGALPKDGYLIAGNKMPCKRIVQKHLGKTKVEWLEVILAEKLENE